MGYINGLVPKEGDMSEQERILQEHFMIIFALRTNAVGVVKPDALASKMVTIDDLKKIIKSSETAFRDSNPCSRLELYTRQSLYPLEKYINSF